MKLDNHRLVGSVEHQATVQEAAGSKPWANQRSGSLNNCRGSSAFVMTSANG